MAIDEQQDWIDRTLARSAWEPPPGFTSRVVVHAMAALPPQTSRLGLRDRVFTTITGIRDVLLARIEASVWVLTQYRALFSRS